MKLGPIMGVSSRMLPLPWFFEPSAESSLTEVLFLCSSKMLLRFVLNSPTM